MPPSEDLQLAHGVTTTLCAAAPHIHVNLVDEDGRIFAGAALNPDQARSLAGVLIRAADVVSQPGTSGAVN